MKLHSILLIAMLVAPALGATTILDVAGQTFAQWQTGGTLTFEIFGGSFAGNAPGFGLSPYPTEVSFALVSAPMSGAGSFSGALGSANGTASVAFGGPLTFGEGAFSGAAYGGTVSILQGYLHLPAPLSQALFGGGSAMLTLRNDGPDITVGLDPYTLRHDLYFSLAGGSLSMGGIIGSVGLEPSAGLLTPDGLGGPASMLSPESLSAAPEPESSGLFLAGGTLLCALSLGLTRIASRRK